jgi:hypothetical protein
VRGLSRALARRREPITSSAAPSASKPAGIGRVPEAEQQPDGVDVGGRGPPSRPGATPPSLVGRITHMPSMHS